ncbi:MAG TPA: IS1595 family transposase [Methylophilus sp.]|uniref:IS1595 family transposase n=1 Tax=Methylophilus sp. TaxID=29541 RepID=UPI002BA0B1F4|nr:IS1595 family transposase [Methylophilus sp.]HSH86811.1 IS1595 family transposase [Methylophilus sp.]
MSILSAPYFHNEEAAYAYVESKLWTNGPVCPHCATFDRIGKMGGKSTRIGTYKCYTCRKPFTVKVGTIFESSHIPMRLWLQAIFLISSSKKGISSNQLHRTLGITIKSAWFMSHRIREAMKSTDVTLFGSNGGDVEVDETFIGRDFTKKPKGSPIGRGYEHKNKVLSLVDRNTKQARSIVVDDLKISTLLPILQANIQTEARLLTDEAGQYTNRYSGMNKHFREHGFTKHGSGEYVSKVDPTVHTNTIEGFFSIFKRGMKGIYQHCAHNHLNRYLAEYDFRYNNRVALGVNDTDRADKLLRGVIGKRLTYKTIN